MPHVPDLVVVGSCAIAAYGWLCAVVPPIARALRTIAARGTSSVWAALALAVGGAVLWSVIPLSLLFVVIMLEPRAGLALVKSPGCPEGGAAGAVCWIVQAATGSMPRIGADFEVATALALVALVDDDPESLSRVERLYRATASPGR